MSVRASPRRRSLSRWVGLACVVFVAAATLPVFWFGFEGLAQEWAKPAFRFKAAVPFLALLLFLQVLGSVPRQSNDDGTRWLGVVGICGALLLAVLGNLIRIDDFVFLAIVGWVVSLMIAGFGVRRTLLFWAPLATLLLMLPVPRFILAQIQRALESVATEVGMGSLRMLGISAAIDGQFLDFGVYRLRTLEVMDGLQNFLPVMLFFFFFATIYRGPLWSRLMPLLLAAPVMVLLCALRILLLGLMVDMADAGAAERTLRLTGDWVFLALSIASLLALTLGSLRLAGHTEAFRSAVDLNLARLGGEVSRVTSIRQTPQLAAAALVTVAVLSIFAIAQSRPTVAIERDAFRLFPPEVSGWSGTRHVIPPGTAAILNADDYVLIDFLHADEAAPVNFWAAYYLAQDRDVGGIHSPEDCLPLDGWNIVSFGPFEVELAGDPPGHLVLNRAVIRRGETEALVYYWFEGRGRSLSNERLARLLVKVDGLLRGRTDGALVRYVTPILEGEADGEADARLQRLLAATIDQLPRFVPK